MTTDGGPAFPHELAAAIDGGSETLDGYLELRSGSDILRDIQALTKYKSPLPIELRDYFASIPINSDNDGNLLGLSCSLFAAAFGKCPDYREYPLLAIQYWLDVEAKLRYMRADAMLAERERHE